MKKFTILAILSALLFSCGVSKDLARTLKIRRHRKNSWH